MKTTAVVLLVLVRCGGVGTSPSASDWVGTYDGTLQEDGVGCPSSEQWSVGWVISADSAEIRVDTSGYRGGAFGTITATLSGDVATFVGGAGGSPLTAHEPDGGIETISQGTLVLDGGSLAVLIVDSPTGCSSGGESVGALVRQ